MRLSEAADPFPGCPDLVGQLGRKWHPDPSGTSEGPVHLLAVVSNPGRLNGLRSTVPVGPSPLGRFRPSGTSSPQTAHEPRSVDVMLTLAAFLFKNHFLFHKVISEMI
jgi:hypothetical protein